MSSIHDPARLRDDLAGAFSVSIVTLPQALSYGLVAYAALGADFTIQAAMLGLYAAMLGGFVAALSGGAPIQITTPKGPLTLIMAGVVAGLAADPALDLQQNTAEIVVGMAAACVVVGGLTQVCLGMFRLGNVVKYVPYPVVSGFMNGIAVLLIVSQADTLLGVPDAVSVMDLLQDPGHIDITAALTGLTTLATVFLVRRFIKGVPASLVALVTGSAVFYGLLGTMNPAAGTTVGLVQLALPDVDHVRQMIAGVSAQDLARLAPTLIASGIVIGLIGSMQSLVSAVVADDLLNQRHDSNRELLGQGLGNVCCGVFGALPVAGSLSRAVLNFRAGGRTRRSGMLAALLILTLTLLGAPLIGHIPLAVIAGLVIAMGFGLIDSWTVNLIKKLKTHGAQRHEVLINLLVSTAVAVITISVNLIIAVAIGIAIAAVLFVRQMSKGFLRRTYSADLFRSRKMRSARDNQLLTDHGSAIQVMELQGALFFGSGDKLNAEIDARRGQTRYLILDMRRVNEVDSTGARILSRIHHALQSEGSILLISHLTSDHVIWPFLEVMDVVEQMGAHRFFPTTDTALEWCEDHLLADLNGDAAQIKSVALEQVSIVDGLSGRELQILRELLHYERYAAGQTIFHSGDRNYDMFLLMAGTVTIYKRLDRAGNGERLITIAPGAVFGELAWLDRQERSADALAVTATELYRFPYAAFQDLRERDPALAIKLITNVGKETAVNLRRTSEALVAVTQG